MTTLKRFNHNPVLLPNKAHGWENTASFNGSLIYDADMYHLLYRAIGTETITSMSSVIGYAESKNGTSFTNRHPFITPEHDWEQYGCEDPRVVKIDDTYYIFYTAISTNPPSPDGIKLAVATTKDFKTILEKHLVTPFNAKAMSLFPEKIDGKYYAILTIDTDHPPAKIAVVSFDHIEQIWDQEYWKSWYENYPRHTLPLLRSPMDQVEVGAAPVKTSHGWLLIYCYITNYFLKKKVFTVEAVLLDANNPLHITKTLHEPLLQPEEYYEQYGIVPNVVFPSGATIKDDMLEVYYGAADTSLCLATMSLNDLFREMATDQTNLPQGNDTMLLPLIRFEANPILVPNPEHEWEKKAVYNSAAITLDDTIHLLYRGQNDKDISTIGYATTNDGFHITDRASEPIYIPREAFELHPDGVGGGCEDPRLTKHGDHIYICYTGYNGKTPRVGFSSISVDDFRNKSWNWSKPQVISRPDVDDKDACLLPEKINGKYVFFHRLGNAIWVDYVDSLNFSEGQYITGSEIFGPRYHSWDDEKIGIGGTPIKTELGWLLIYHGISTLDGKYRLGVALLHLEDPKRILVRLDEPILEPEVPYEFHGLRSGTVFSNGAAVKDDTLFVYYGAADQQLCVARINYQYLINKLKEYLPTQHYHYLVFDDSASAVQLPEYPVSLPHITPDSL